MLRSTTEAWPLSTQARTWVPYSTVRALVKQAISKCAICRAQRLLLDRSIDIITRDWQLVSLVKAGHDQQNPVEWRSGAIQKSGWRHNAGVNGMQTPLSCQAAIACFGMLWPIKRCDNLRYLSSESMKCLIGGNLLAVQA